MVTTLFQIFLLISILIILYAFYRYLKSPERQLNKAYRLNEYFYLDDQTNIKFNLRIAYQGCLFEGEKHLGIAKDAFKIIRINMTVQDQFELKGITKYDLIHLEQKIHENYPDAKISWLHPVNQIV